MGRSNHHLGPQGPSDLVQGVDHRMALVWIEQGDQLGELVQGLGQLTHGWFRLRSSKPEVTMD